MQNRKFSASACVRGILGLLLTIGVFTFLKPCVHADRDFGTCHWAGQMLAGLGIVVVVQAVAGMFCGNAKMREGISLAMLPVALLAALTPGIIIPLCMMETMRCNVIMKPATLLIAVLIALLSAVDVVMQHRQAGREKSA